MKKTHTSSLQKSLIEQTRKNTQTILAILLELIKQDKEEIDFTAHDVEPVESSAQTQDPNQTVHYYK